MLQVDRLDPLSELLQAMTRATSGDTAYVPSPRLQCLEKILLVGYVVIMIVVVVVAIWYRVTLPKPIHGTPLLVEAFFVVGQCVAILYLAVMIFEIQQALWKYRPHDAASSSLSLLQQALCADAPFLKQLRTFNKETLEYGLVQYRHSVETFDGRVASLVGELRKVGLFPALMAVDLAAATLIKDSSNLYLWTPVVVTGCLYMLGFFVINQRARPAQVIALLEYVIRYANEPTTDSPPASGADTESAECSKTGAEAPSDHNSPRSANDTVSLPATTT